jgi:hypothetical protein
MTATLTSVGGSIPRIARIPRIAPAADLGRVRVGAGPLDHGGIAGREDASLRREREADRDGGDGRQQGRRDAGQTAYNPSGNCRTAGTSDRGSRGHSGRASW